ncbi:hypothetical protein [Priestia koreensis]|uniref:hypothetical protein n=1 Tax=Priestia koreensis TaxID=284581 RepID=UPI00345AC58A
MFQRTVQEISTMLKQTGNLQVSYEYSRVLLKGSRGLKMEEVVEKLMEETNQ